MNSRKWSFCLLLFSLSCVLTRINAVGVLGVDLGNAFTKLGYVIPGQSFDIVLDPTSKRKTPTFLSFKPIQNEESSKSHDERIKKYERFFGYEGFSQLSKNPSLTFPNEIPLRFTETQIKSMLLDHFATYAEIKDVVLVVSNGATQRERQQILAAAEVAGLKVLSLVNQNSAAVINMITWNDFEHLQKNESETILFFNMGAKNTELTIANFTRPGKTVETKIIFHDTIRDFGGGLFDKLVADDLFSEFKASNPALNFTKYTQEQIDRVYARFFIKAIKVKEVLSANENIPVSIESVFDIDFRSSYSRERMFSKFQEAEIDLEERLSSVLIPKVDKVEILGGGVRMPRVKQFLTDTYGEVGHHLNGDEAMALGATFLGANLSTSFRVKNVKFQDFYKNEIKVRFSAEEWERNAILFPSESPLGSKKTFSFDFAGGLVNQSDINIELSEVLTEDEEFATYKIPLKDLNKVYTDSIVNETLPECKISLTFSLSLNSTVEITKANYQMRYNFTTVEVTETPEQDDATENETDSEENISSSDESEAAAPVKNQTKAKKIKKALVVEEQENRYSVSAREKDSMRNMLKAYSELEEVRAKVFKYENDLEGIILGTRGFIRDLPSSFETPETQESLDRLEFLEDWLYEDHSSDKAAYMADLADYSQEVADMKGEYVQKLDDYWVKDDLMQNTRELLEDVRNTWMPENEFDNEDIKKMKALLKTEVEGIESWMSGAEIVLQDARYQFEGLQYLVESLIREEKLIKLREIQAAKAKLRAEEEAQKAEEKARLEEEESANENKSTEESEAESGEVGDEGIADEIGDVEETEEEEVFDDEKGHDDL